MGAASTRIRRHSDRRAVSPAEQVDAPVPDDSPVSPASASAPAPDVGSGDARRCSVASEESDGAPEDTADKQGRTTLHRAAEAGDAVLARCLLGRGASPNTADSLGRTPTMTAADLGDVALCELLLDAGGEMDASDRFGQTALHIAAERGATAVVSLLLRRGADPRAVDGCGRSPLQCALQLCNLPAAEALLPVVLGTGPPQRDDTGRTDLHWAAANGTAAMVLELGDRLAGDGGAGRDHMGMSPLIRALQARNSDTAIALLDSLPIDGAPDKFGRTALHWAAFAGFHEVVLRLLQAGLSPWEVDLCGRDALFWAVEGGDLQTVETILEKKGYRERADARGQTALHLAAARGDAAVVSRLLAAGAEVGHADFQGRIPLALSLRGGHEHASTQQMLQMEPVEVRRRDCLERTLLHWAAVGGDARAVRYLLAQGAKVNALDARGLSAATLAVRRGHEAAVLELVEAEGFRALRDRAGRTPLHGAAAAGWQAVATRLCEMGVDPHAGDNDFTSAVMMAVRSGHYQLARAMSDTRQLYREQAPASQSEDSDSS